MTSPHKTIREAKRVKHKLISPYESIKAVIDKISAEALEKQS